MCIAALALSAGAAYATVGQPDGYINGMTGGTGYFAEDHSPNGCCDNFVEKSNPMSSGLVIFDYDDNTWVVCGETFWEEQTDISVVLDIEMYCRETLEATDIYFHVGDGEAVTQMSTTVNGSISTNNGQYLGLTKVGWTSTDGPTALGGSGRCEQLAFVTDGFGRDKAWFETNQPQNTPNDIPLTIEFSDDGGTTWRKIYGTTAGPNDGWSDGTGGLWGYWWLVANGEPCTHDYQFRFTADLVEHEHDGRYELDPLFVVEPYL
jgi:hypothetical protein